MGYRIGVAASSVALACGLACAVRAQDDVSELERALEGLECTLGDECERWGPWIEGGGGTQATCLASEGPPTPTVWSEPLAVPSCPFGLGACTIYDQQLTLDADGSLITLAALWLPTEIAYEEAGLWLTRHARGGEFASSVLLDFSVPPPGIMVQRHAALLRDRAGRAVFASSRALLPFAEPRALQASWFSRSARPERSAFFSTPPGWGFRAALDPSGDWLVASQRKTRTGVSTQGSVTRYGRRGRALWTRSWPAASEVDAVHVAPDRSVLVLAQDRQMGERTLYKLDERGVAVWRRVVSSWFEVTQVAAAADGGIYVATLLERPDFPSAYIRVQRLEPSGQGSASWEIPNDGWVTPTLASDESGNVMLALPGFTGDWLPTLDWYAFDSDTCQRTSYEWPSVSSAPPEPVAVYADRRGARFFATFQMVGQLRERGQP